MIRSRLSTNAGPHEKRCRLLVRMIFVIYWLAIFEGVLRKYVFPEASRVLFFIKDPVVVFLYCFALKNRLFPLKSNVLKAGLIFLSVSIPLLLIQWSVSPEEFSWLIAVYGWRNYFLYIPVAFFAARYVTLSDVHVLARRTLLVATAVAPLVYFQFLAPNNAPINQGFGQNQENVFLNSLSVDGSIIRPTGTFTSPVGEGCFLATCTAMLLGTWILPARRRPLTGWRLWAATAAVFSSLALSGSRGTIIMCGIICCASVVAVLASGDNRMAIQRLAKPVLVLMVGLAATPVAFPVAVGAFVQRWQSAGAAESEGFGYGLGIFGRILFDVGAFTLLLPVTPPLGYQLGIAGNGAFSLNMSDRIGTTDARMAMAIEGEWGRNIVELGPTLGLAYIALRLALIVKIIRGALAASRRWHDPFPILLCAFAAITLFQGQITGNGALVAYAWLFSGFCLIAKKTSRI